LETLWHPLSRISWEIKGRYPGKCRDESDSPR
jgi:hypothetical protein